MFDIKYQKRHSARAKYLSISVHQDSHVIVTVPRWVSDGAIERFVEKNILWIKRKIIEQNKHPRLSFPFSGKRSYKKYKEGARKIIEERTAHLNQYFNFEYKRISIRDQKTRWGSCSERGNLNFSYKLAFLPERLRDYVIIHELCHLKEMNHGKGFWALVATLEPDYKELRRVLKKYTL